MAATWSKGQNAELGGVGFLVRILAPVEVDLSALLVGPSDRVRSDADFVFYNQPGGQGVAYHPVGVDPQHLTIDLSAVGSDVERVLAVVSLDDQATTFGEVTSPTASLHDLDASLVGTFVMSGLGLERAVVAFEFYRRGERWKVRAVGQGYAEGLAELAIAHGVDVAPPESPEPPTPPPGIAAPVPVGGAAPTPPPGAATPTPPPGAEAPVSVGGAPVARSIRVSLGHAPPPVPDPRERCYDQIWAIFEDAARSAAAFESASEYAEQRLERELSELVADPATRNSPRAAAARTEAQRRHDDLVTRADADRQRDTAHLCGELGGLCGTLPAAMAAWGDPVWRGWRPPSDPVAAVRVGELHLPRRPELRVPFVLRLPLSRPLWVDSGGGYAAEAAVLARCLTARLLAAHPCGALTVHVVDLAGGGSGVKGLQPLLSTGSRLIAPPVTSPARLGEALAELVARVDMVRMAARAGAVDVVNGSVGSGARLVVLHDFPYGLDERGMAAVRFLVEVGPSAGIFLLLVADPSDAAAAGSEAEAVWRSAIRLAAVEAESVCDPWVGQTWTYVPDSPKGGRVVDNVFAALAGASFGSGGQ